jgi:CO/xanthine dehydrogenase FAD-binding subunit
MIPAEFEYARPDTLKEALALLRDRPYDCRVMAGGQRAVSIAS